jgi:hypothetical protein
MISTKFRNVSLGLAGTLVLSMPALSNDTKSASSDGLMNDVRTGINDLFDNQTVTIEFSGSQKTLSQDAKDKIKSLMNSFKGERALENAHVAVWGAYNFDSAEFRNNESKRDSDLIDDRAESVEDYINEVASGVDVETYNMAENPNWFEKTFNLDAAKLKSAMKNEVEREKIFTDKGDRKLAELAKVFSSEGGADKAVIVFERKPEDKLSH